MRFHKLVLAPLIGFFLAGSSVAQPNPFESVPPLPEPAVRKITGPAIEAIEFRGARRVSQFALRAMIESRVGGPYDVETLRHDSHALSATGRFSDVIWESEAGPAGAIVRFMVAERPVIQSIEYEGNGGTVTIGEILERFEQRKVRLKAETLYNEAELGRATAAVQELVTEKGRRNMTVTSLVEPILPPSTVSWPPENVKIKFTVKDAARPK